MFRNPGGRFAPPLTREIPLREGRYVLIALALFVALGPATTSARNAKLLLEDVRDRHRAALEAIRTVTYSYEWKHLKDEALHFEHGTFIGTAESSHEIGPRQYWQSPDARRTRSHYSDGRTVDELFRFGQLIRATTPKKNEPDQSLKVTSETVSAFQRGDGLATLFEHWSRDSKTLPFHGLLLQPHKIRSVERHSGPPSGHPGEIRVVLENDNGVYEFWFSPKHNYLIRKRIEHPVDELRHRYEDEVSEFVEPNPGQFFPARIERRLFEAGELKQHVRRNLSEVRVNRPVPNEAFRIPGIEGCLCDDLTRKMQFRVDADGYRFGVDTTVHQSARLELPWPPARPDTTGDTSTVFWLGVTITLLVLGLCVAIFEIRWLRAELRKRPVPKLSGS